MKTLSHQQAKQFYDRFGRKQDWQRFYEDPATTDLLAHLHLPEAQSLFEFGCGTGRFAQSLLAKHLPPTASYVGVDVSSTMIALSQALLAAFGARARVQQTVGEIHFDQRDASMDRFIALYVLDLLSEADARAVLDEALRLLRPGGLLGLVSLTHGATASARVVERAWTGLFRLRPMLVGGCRPIDLRTLIDPERWVADHYNVITRFGISSQVVVAKCVSGREPVN